MLAYERLGGLLTSVLSKCPFSGIHSSKLFDWKGTKNCIRFPKNVGKGNSEEVFRGGIELGGRNWPGEGAVVR